MKILSDSLFIALGALYAVAAAAEPVISIGSDTLAPNGAAVVALEISGLTTGAALGAFDLSVGFNSGLLSLKSVIYGDPILGDQLNLSGFGPVTSTIQNSGNVELFEVSLDSPATLASSQAPAFTLATLTFSSLLDSGRSTLALASNAIADQNAGSLGATLQNGSITVQGSPMAAPEIDSASAATNATLLLAALAILQSKRRRASAVQGYQSMA